MVTRKVRYSCIRCKKEFNARLDYHLTHCKKAIENIDYISCKICRYKGQALYSHIKKHNLTKEEYQERYGEIYSQSAKTNISLRNSITQGKHNYRNKLKKQGNLSELEKFNQDVGKSVSDSILNNKEEQARRSKLLGQLNKRDDFRKRASETAIKTSAREDIQQQRAKNLKKWRDENPEIFHEKCTSQMHKFKSKPEKELYNFCFDLNCFFKKNQYLKRKSFETKTKKRQVDVLDVKKKIVVEYDGELHFVKKFDKQNLELQKEKDANFNNSLKSEFCIIRVAYDQFSYRKSDYGFKKECLEKIKEILDNPQVGLYCLGDSYGKSNIL